MNISKFLGGMIGCAIGDAIGELAFLYPKKDKLCHKIDKTNQLCYTDDTAMAIGIARSIIEKGDIEEEHLGKKLSDEFYREPWRGYASGPPAVFRMVKEKGIPYHEAAKMLFYGEGSFGNGAAMRIAPVGLFFYNAFPELFYEKAKISACVTHAHPIGIDGAVIQARAVSIATRLNPVEEFFFEDFIDELIRFAKTYEMKTKMEMVKSLLEEDVTPKIAASRLGMSVAVYESVPFAIYSFLKYSKSFKECLLCAVLNGGDRDTLGAMACSISGAYLGIDAIPKKWIKKLENFLLIKNLALELYEVHINNSRV